MHEFIVEDGSQGERLDVFLEAMDPDLTRSRIQNLIRDGLVTVNGKYFFDSITVIKG